MITPDTKDWTWVIDRPCPDCGFDATAVAPGQVAGLVRDNAAAWRRLLAGGAIRAGRPDPGTWSPLEYACHVRDVYTRYDGRLALMLGADDPLFPNWDQDASADEDRYEAQDPGKVVAALAAAAEALAGRLDGVRGAQWDRPGRRSDGASFTVGTIARYMVHDTVHHVWDVAGERATRR